MNNDIIEIFKICDLFKKEEISEKKVDFVLNRVFCETSDSSRMMKHEYFENNNKEIFERLRKEISWLFELCSEDLCSECTMKKWCNHYRNVVQIEEAKSDKPIVADFFCGAGGLSLGFYRSGYKISLANDIQECCIDTISFNHPEVPEKYFIADDIENVIDNINQLSRYPKIDVVVGGPPCQGFSMANRQRLIDDPRNHLYKSFVRAISEIKPQFFVMENVRGILKVKNQIFENFEELGYSVEARLLNAKEFGVPQNRERVIFIGNRIGIDNNILFEEIYSIANGVEKSVLADALAGLRKLQAKTIPNSTEDEDDVSGHTFEINSHEGNTSYVQRINEGKIVPLVFNHKARYNNERDIEIYRRLEQGDDSSNPKIADIMPYKRREKIFKDKYYKLEENKVCKTITAHMKFDCNMYIHPTQARGLTPREAARIQSYPDDYFFRGSYTKTYMQVGNSVPPIMSQVIAEVIKNYLKKED